MPLFVLDPVKAALHNGIEPLLCGNCHEDIADLTSLPRGAHVKRCIGLVGKPPSPTKHQKKRREQRALEALDATQGVLL